MGVLNKTVLRKLNGIGKVSQKLVSVAALFRNTVMQFRFIFNPRLVLCKTPFRMPKYNSSTNTLSTINL